MRGSEKTRSILAAADHTASEQCSGVRPSLDALAHAICADVGNRARLGRPLPLPLPTSPARVDELLGAAIGLVRGGR